MMEAGAVGGFNAVLVNLTERYGLYPQFDAYRTRMLSPAPAAALLLKDKISLCDCNEPESINAEPPSAPTMDHSHPLAAPAVVVDTGKFGAVYR